MWYIYKMEYYLAIKKSEIMSFVATWMGLEIIILSEVSQTDKDNYFPYLFVESKQMLQMNLLTKQKHKTHRRQTYGYEREDMGGSDKLGDWG